MKLSLLFILLISFTAQAKLIDKIAGVINDRVYTLSEIDRVLNTIEIRKEIAPFIYTKKNYSQKDILKTLQNSFIIKDKLEELGFIVSDDSVEDRIRETQKSLNLNRQELVKFLQTKNITFSEYFEILREAMEYNIFNRRIIAPLVTITDQELKNEYYKGTTNKKALSYRYEVVDYTINKLKVIPKDIPTLPKVLSTYRKTGNLPEIYNDFNMDDLGKVSGEDLPQNIRLALRDTNEKNFSNPVLLDDTIHVFYILKKSIAESKDYLKVRNAIYNRLFLQRANDLSENWFSRESLNYYILDNL